MTNRTLNRNQNTEYSLEFFNQYAADALRKQNYEVSEALKRRQVPAGKLRRLEDAYKISVRLKDDISLNSIKKQLLQQIEAAALFIRDFQISVLGQRTSIFHLYEIELQIGKAWGDLFSFESGKLSIQLPYWQVNFLNHQIPYQEIKTRWHRGNHLNRFSPTCRVWWLFNPIGEFRSNLRAMLLLAVQKQILGIDQLFIKFGLVDTGGSPSRTGNDGVPINPGFKENAIAFLKATVKEDKLGVNLELALKNQDEASLARLLGLYKKNLADPGQLEEIVDTGVLSLQEVITEEQSEVNIKMFGFVNVGNYHRIDVALNVSSGFLRKYVEIIPRKAQVKAVQFGFVNVYTIDDITVKPNFHGAMKFDFETAALERTLRELQLAG